MYRKSNPPDIIYADKEVDPKTLWVGFFPFTPNLYCPSCYTTNKTGSFTTSEGCLGKQSFWSQKWKCPNIPHLHMKCWFCKLKFNMWGKSA